MKLTEMFTAFRSAYRAKQVERLIDDLYKQGIVVGSNLRKDLLNRKEFKL